MFNQQDLLFTLITLRYLGGGEEVRMWWRCTKHQNLPRWAWFDIQKVESWWRHTKHQNHTISMFSRQGDSGHGFNSQQVGMWWTRTEHQKHAQMNIVSMCGMADRHQAEHWNHAQMGMVLTFSG